MKVHLHIQLPSCFRCHYVVEWLVMYLWNRLWIPVRMVFHLLTNVWQIKTTPTHNPPQATMLCRVTNVVSRCKRQKYSYLHLVAVQRKRIWHGIQDKNIKHLFKCGIPRLPRIFLYEFCMELFLNNCVTPNVAYVTRFNIDLYINKYNGKKHLSYTTSTTCHGRMLASKHTISVLNSQCIPTSASMLPKT
jgi:hypothetical protein